MSTALKEELERRVSLDTLALHAKGYVASLSIGYWKGIKTDNKVASEVEEMKGALHGTAIVNKWLVNKGRVEQYAVPAREAREFHDYMTAPWDVGKRFVSEAGVEAWVTGLETRKQKWLNDKVEPFLAWYDRTAEEQRGRMGKLWRAQDYPSVEQLRDKFRFEFGIEPLSDVGTLRKRINIEAANDLINRTIDARTSKMVNVAQSAWQRTHEVITHLMEKLKDYEPGGKVRLHDSTLQNVVQLVDTLPLLNVLEDPRLLEIQRELKSRLLIKAGSTEILKASKQAREETAEEAERMLAAIDEVLRGKK